MENTKPFTWTHNIVWLLEIAAYGAVDCYALISGYVGVYSKHRYSSFLVLWLRVVFYSVLFTLINKILFPDVIEMKKIALSFLPICQNMYWYFTSYFILFLFVPLLNYCLNNLEKKAIKIFLLSIVSVVSIVLPIVKVLGGDIFVLNGGYSPWWLIILYLLGGYIRKYGLLERIKKHYLLLIFISSVVLTWLSKLCIEVLSQHFLGKIIYDNILVSYLSITVLVSAISLLLLFSRLQFRRTITKIIAFLSPLAFSVYIIHLQSFIKTTFITDKSIWIKDLPLYAIVPVVIGCAFIIYIVCSLIDVGRLYLFKWLKVKERLSAFEIRIEER